MSKKSFSLACQLLLVSSFSIAGCGPAAFTDAGPERDAGTDRIDAGAFDGGFETFDGGAVDGGSVPHDGGPQPTDAGVLDGGADENDAGHAACALDPTCNVPPSITEIADQEFDEDTSSGRVFFTVSDEDPETDLDALVVTAEISTPGLVDISLSTISATERYLTMGGFPDMFGTAEVTLTVDDGESENSRTSTRFIVNVRSINDTPTVSYIPTQSLVELDEFLHVPFTIDDIDNDVEDIVVTAVSSDQNLLPNRNLLVLGSGAERTLSILPNFSGGGGGGLVDILILADDQENYRPEGSGDFELRLHAFRRCEPNNNAYGGNSSNLEEAPEVEAFLTFPTMNYNQRVLIYLSDWTEEAEYPSYIHNPSTNTGLRTHLHYGRLLIYPGETEWSFRRMEEAIRLIVQDYSYRSCRPPTLILVGSGQAGAIATRLAESESPFIDGVINIDPMGLGVDAFANALVTQNLAAQATTDDWFYGPPGAPVAVDPSFVATDLLSSWSPEDLAFFQYITGQTGPLTEEALTQRLVWSIDRLNMLRREIVEEPVVSIGEAPGVCFSAPPGNDARLETMNSELYRQPASPFASAELAKGAVSGTPTIPVISLYSDDAGNMMLPFATGYADRVDANGATDLHRFMAYDGTQENLSELIHAAAEAIVSFRDDGTPLPTVWPAPAQEDFDFPAPYQLTPNAASGTSYPCP